MAVVDEYPSLFRKLNFITSLPSVTSLPGSEAMSLVQFFVPTEVAHDTVAELGELGNVEFKDVRSPFTPPTPSPSDPTSGLGSSTPT